MKQYTLAIIVAVAQAGLNEYATDWENTIPQCEIGPVSCGYDGVCEEGRVCADFYGYMKCFKIWRDDFCWQECDEGMVNNPRRYCDCITPDELTAMFCEVPDPSDYYTEVIEFYGADILP